MELTVLLPELNVILEHYQLNLNYSYTNWIKKLQEIGYEVKNPVQIEFRERSTLRSKSRIHRHSTRGKQAFGK